MTTMSGSGQEVPDDLPVRESGSWVADKLAILRCYLPAFSRACSNKAKAWYFVDGLAGPGVNIITDTGERVYGSPLIALTADPPFTKCLLMDYGQDEVIALRHRVQPFGDRAVVERADVNTSLSELMRKHLDPWAPCLCLLDPEGTELKWATIERVASFRRGKAKTELLILLPTYTGFVRMLPARRDDAIAEDKLDEMFGTTEWRDIWKRRKSFWISKQQAPEKYLELYKEQLRRLGYATVLSRLIRARGKLGRPMYHLIFATDNPAGARIMDYCFETQYEAKQQSLLD